MACRHHDHVAYSHEPKRSHSTNYNLKILFDITNSSIDTQLNEYQLGQLPTETIMQTPDIEKIKTPDVKQVPAERPKTESDEIVRPNVAQLIDRVVNENSPTWQELAKH